MSDAVKDGAGWRGSVWRRGMWGVAALLLVLPAVAMRFTDEVVWTGSDFVFAAVLLFGSAGLVDLAALTGRSLAYKIGVAVAVGAAFLTIWANAAVGMIGSEDNPYNLWFLGVVALAVIGAIAAGFRAGGMAWAMAAAGVAQAVLGAVGMSADMRGGIFAMSFAGLWLLSAALLWSGGRQAV